MASSTVRVNLTPPLALGKGGTGATTAKGAEFNIIGGVETVETTPTDARYIALRNETVNASNGTFRWTKLTNVFSWIKSKIEGTLMSLFVSTLKYSVGGRQEVFLDVTGDVSSGVKLVIGAGGPTVVGGGESAQTIAPSITSDTEVLHLTSDEVVKIQTNIQNGADAAKTTTFEKDGSITTAGPIKVAASATGTSASTNIQGTMGGSDYWRIASGGTSDNGFLEIATADNGTEPIYVRQYNGQYTSLARTLTLLDGSGNSTFPVKVSAPIIQPTKELVVPTGKPNSSSYCIWFE